MGTLLFHGYPALAQIETAEALFLSALVSDAVRDARKTGRYVAQFHTYRLQAWREPLGEWLCAVNWRVDRGDCPVARDTAIAFL